LSIELAHPVEALGDTVQKLQEFCA
jgi:hypothetical protein